MDSARILEGEVYAIEPFVTTREAAGSVKEAGFATIYRVAKLKKPKEAGELFKAIYESFRTLPFARRWVGKVAPWASADEFEALVRSRHLFGYQVLIEASGRPVAQAEHTVVVTKDGCEVLT